MKSKAAVILARIKHTEDAITKAREYLESGKHAHWHGFRPLFIDKVKNGKIVPPHRDWVKNVFLRNCEKALRKEEKLLERIEDQSDGKSERMKRIEN